MNGLRFDPELLLATASASAGNLADADEDTEEDNAGNRDDRRQSHFL